MLSEQLRKIRSDIHCNGDAGMGSRMILSIKEPQAWATWSDEAGTCVEYSFQHVQVMNNWETVDGQHWFCWFLF